ncbi:hypothetical protein [Lactobacillus sp. ESL0225]|uniref:hypothetical protein n=1 Tax=Lactobacillus sp. ESL0225 TaxID=2069351 RepID=UPI000EFD8EC9|nr:hypothetical protein [Lactobacillus sp. ESL0225]RMC51180.1 hypothetical protein F5ESL0225_02180 [Lactobacillus sp. ESL0225]
MKKLVTMIALTATTNPAQVTQTNNQLSKGELGNLKVALNGSLSVYVNSSDIYQVKIVDKSYLANSLNRSNLKLTVEEVQAELNKVNEVAQNDPEDFSYENPLLRKKKNRKLCSNTFKYTGDALGTVFMGTGSALGSPLAGAVFRYGYKTLMHTVGNAVC